ncbi:hypothetical protein L2E82_11156 [Cichorium intybus]|uniref:Uncharacterized protein n=1 Tax=Cichorium intybus TaxID=13427 RepID=A0ACB9GCB2_CICIN|nr:hypothetical protein L2E82_11156 [Cichorium intybus]
MPLPLNEREMTPPSRPSVKRKRNVSKKDDMYRTTRAVTCKNCLEKGHNIRSCPNAKRLLPQKEKKKEKDDKYPITRAITCKNCLEKGHNIRSCKNGRRLLPLKEKKKEKDDKYPTTRTIITCKNCLEKGHNIRSCQNAKRLLPPKEKKKVGRPRIADQGGAYRITRRSTRGGTSGTMEEENLKKHVEAVKELHMEETMEVPTSMNTTADEAGDDDESIDETQATIDDLRKSGYTEDEIDAIHADEAQDDDDDDDDNDDDDDDDEGIEEITQSAAIKGRRSSERIIKIKLKKKIDGKGSTLGTPIDIE